MKSLKKRKLKKTEQSGKAENLSAKKKSPMGGLKILIKFLVGLIFRFSAIR